VIVWTPEYPARKRFLGYLRLLRARFRFHDHYWLRRRPGRILPERYVRPGYATIIRNWRDRNKGQRCFIMANGPSLKDMDLSMLRDEVTIGVNGIYKLFDEWGFSTDYLLFEDTEQTELRGPEIHTVEGPVKMAAVYNAYCIEKPGEDMLFINVRRADKYYWETMGVRFSDDFSNIVYLGSTITYIAMQLAFHLGCDPVYVIGLDHNYGELSSLFPPGKITITEENIDLVRQCHFSKNYYKIGDKIGVPNVLLQEEAYEKARETYELHGRQLLNATKGGCLEIFDRVNFESLF
jgi:hypothetical protein